MSQANAVPAEAAAVQWHALGPEGALERQAAGLSAAEVDLAIARASAAAILASAVAGSE